MTGNVMKDAIKPWAGDPALPRLSSSIWKQGFAAWMYDGRLSRSSTVLSDCLIVGWAHIYSEFATSCANSWKA